jgi:hypothetical protein
MESLQCAEAEEHLLLRRTAVSGFLPETYLIEGDQW